MGQVGAGKRWLGDWATCKMMELLGLAKPHRPVFVSDPERQSVVPQRDTSPAVSDFNNAFVAWTFPVFLSRLEKKLIAADLIDR